MFIVTLFSHNRKIFTMLKSKNLHVLESEQCTLCMYVVAWHHQEIKGW